jgi:TusA-related sulfurtransferase
MEFTITKTITINVGDVIEVLTNDGWEVANVTAVTKDKISALVIDFDKELEFTIDEIR